MKNSDMYDSGAAEGLRTPPITRFERLNGLYFKRPEGPETFSGLQPVVKSYIFEFFIHFELFSRVAR